MSCRHSSNIIAAFAGDTIARFTIKRVKNASGFIGKIGKITLDSAIIPHIERTGNVIAQIITSSKNHISSSRKDLSSAIKITARNDKFTTLHLKNRFEFFITINTAESCLEGK